MSEGLPRPLQLIVLRTKNFENWTKGHRDSELFVLGKCVFGEHFGVTLGGFPPTYFYSSFQEL